MFTSFISSQYFTRLSLYTVDTLVARLPHELNLIDAKIHF